MANQQEMTLQSIAGERLFEVPDYQRPYAWEEKQLSDLWSDLDLMSSHRHYAGTLVLNQQPGDPKLTNSGLSLTVHDVVDGQQRLTTCFLLLDRIRRALEQIDHDDARDTAHTIRTTYGWVSIAGVKRPKLTLGRDLDEFWSGSILGDDPAGLQNLNVGQKRLQKASNFFDAHISSLLDGCAAVEFLARLQGLNARIVSGLRFLVYEVSDTADVGVIFETLNERGRQLSEMEKIKNYLLYLVRPLPEDRGTAMADVINKAWGRIVQHLSGLPSGLEDTVLRAHWLATENPQSRQWKRTASVKGRFPRSRYVPAAQTLTGAASITPTDETGWDQLVADVQTYVKSLEHAALFAAELHSSTPAFVDFESHRAEARDAQTALRRTGVFALFFPLIFAARLARPHDGELYANLVRLCETYAARVFVIAQRRSNAGESWLNYIAHEFVQHHDREKFLNDLRAAIWHYANDERVATALTTSDNWYERRGHKYFLYEYERSLLSGSSKSTLKPFENFVSSSYAETTEHILRRTRTTNHSGGRTSRPAEHESLRHSSGTLSSHIPTAATATTTTQ